MIAGDGFEGVQRHNDSKIGVDNNLALATHLQSRRTNRTAKEFAVVYDHSPNPNGSLRQALRFTVKEGTNKSLWK